MLVLDSTYLPKYHHKITYPFFFLKCRQYTLSTVLYVCSTYLDSQDLGVGSFFVSFSPFLSLRIPNPIGPSSSPRFHFLTSFPQLPSPCLPLVPLSLSLSPHPPFTGHSYTMSNQNNPFVGSPPRQTATHPATQDPSSLTDLCSLIPSSATENTGSPHHQQSTSDQILNVLKARFLSDLPYIWLSPRCIVTLSANKHLSVNSDQSMNAYAVDWRDCSEDRRRRIEQDSGYGYGTGPHIWALAGKAYYYMRRTGGDQSILITFVGFFFNLSMPF